MVQQLAVVGTGAGVDIPVYLVFETVVCSLVSSAGVAFKRGLAEFALVTTPWRERVW